MVDTNIIEQSIIKTLGLEHLGLADRMKITNQLIQIVQRRIMVRVVKDLSDEALQEYMDMTEKGDVPRMSEFIEAHIPNYYDMIIEETLRLKEEMNDVSVEIDGAQE